jgi:hypothetical protein
MPTTAAPASDMTMTNPYAMHTYGMPAPMMGAPVMGAHTNSALHSMQNMYMNTQMQPPMMQSHPQHPQLASPAYMHGMPPSTTQNVSVVDFKPDALVNSQIAHLHQQYQNKLNSMTPAPGLGLIGPDGRYTAATAATPHTPMYQDAYAPHTAAPYHNAIPDHMAAYHARNARNDHMSPYSRGMEQTHAEAYHNDLPRRPRSQPRHAQSEPVITESRLADLIDKSVERRVKETAASVTPVDAGFHTKSQEEQRVIVGNAVKSAISKMADTPSKKQSLYNTSSPYTPDHSPYDRYA